VSKNGCTHGVLYNVREIRRSKALMEILEILSVILGQIVRVYSLKRLESRQ
jgi:hypothetical protein